MNYAAYYVPPLLVTPLLPTYLQKSSDKVPLICAGLRPELCCLLRAAAAGEQLLPVGQHPPHQPRQPHHHCLLLWLHRRLRGQ
jgi:hypothetical protein